MERYGRAAAARQPSPIRATVVGRRVAGWVVSRAPARMATWTARVTPRAENAAGGGGGCGGRRRPDHRSRHRRAAGAADTRKPPRARERVAGHARTDQLRRGDPGHRRPPSGPGGDAWGG